MIEIKVYSDIANHKEGIWMSMFGFEDMVFSADTVRNIFEEHKKEKDFKFNIHCDGGSTSEGFAIYDIIRTSGKNIYTNIDGSCHSMAMVLLLAAPFENRTANRNARALIHRVYAYSGEYMNAEELRGLADYADEEQQAILDIYEDRTGADREVLENLMKEEKIRTAQELLEYGFISEINNYTTNKFFKKMSTNKKKRGGWLSNLLSSKTTMNYDFTDEGGEVLFSTEAEDDTLEVGMAASPDGTYELEDGRTVVITEGFITEIYVDASDVEELAEEVVNLRNQLSDKDAEITELKNQLGSDYKVRNRSRTGKNKQVTPSKDELKNSVREKRENWKGKKGGK